MAFTTGYVGQQSCGVLETTEECARSVYTQRPHVHPAGTFFDYNSDHTRIAAAMAEAASGETILALIQRLIFDRTTPPMTASSFSNPIRPDLAAALTTTPRDYEGFLSSYYRGELVSADGRMVMESDQCPACEACSFCQTRGHCEWAMLPRFRTRPVSLIQICLHVDGLGNWAGCIGWGEADGGQWSTRCAVAGEFCKIATLSQFATLFVSLTPKASLLQGALEPSAIGRRPSTPPPPTAASTTTSISRCKDPAATPPAR